MKILVITSNQPRHDYFASMVKKLFKADVKVLTISKSEKHFTKRSGRFFLQHHSDYKQIERKVFQSKLDIAYTHVDRKKINDIQFVKNTLSECFDLVLVFGSPILNKIWFNEIPSIPKVNFHLGLSPFYVGSGTLFWPFVNDEPEMAGVTVHELTEELDMGNPIQRYRFARASGNYYELSNIIVRHSIDSGLLYLSNMYSSGENYTTFSYEQGIAPKKYFNDELTESAIKIVRSKFPQHQEIDYDITSC